MAALQEEMRYTYSVCPVCLKRIPAERVERADGIDLVKTCPEHGTFSSVIWRNRVDFSKWRGSLPPVGETENLRCPTGCGLCPEVFSMDDEDKAEAFAPAEESNKSQVQEAIDGCPVEAISWED